MTIIINFIMVVIETCQHMLLLVRAGSKGENKNNKTKKGGI